MLINQLLEIYNVILNSIIMCYIIYRLNADLKKAPALNYFFSSLIIVLIICMIKFMFPEIDKVMSLTLDILILTFVIKSLHKYSLYYSLITAILGIVLLGFAETFSAITYILPLRLNALEYKSNFIHISVGSTLMFIVTFVLLKFIANNFIKARRRVYKKHKKLTVLLSVNLISVFVILLFVYGTFGFYMEYKIISDMGNAAYYGLAITSIILIASIIGTLYLINYFILNSLKYDRLKMSRDLDAMTDTLNRSSGLRFIEDQLQICKMSKKDLTICYIDVNDLKVINDMLGHREGDQLIKAIVKAVKENIRETDVISRLGGDEFVIIFPGCNIEYGEKVMGRISNKVKNLDIFKSYKYTVSISYGFSEYGGNCEITVDGLLHQADQQMYVNKRALKAIV